MLSIYQLSIPTPYPVGPVNVYLLKNDPLTLLDAGPDTAEARKKLQEKLYSLGVKLTDIKRIFVTHAHPDHFGLASWIHEMSGARVYTHSCELPRMTGESDHIKDRIPFVQEAGLPAPEMEKVMGQRDKLPHPFLQTGYTSILHGGETFYYGDDELEVMCMPGHAPGHLCFYNRRGGYFFSGDFLLPHITPNPVMEPDPENPSRRLPVLRLYLERLEVLEKMHVNTVWPGHGGVFNDYRGVIESARRHHEKQFATIKKILEKGTQNCYQVSRAAYPKLKGWDVFMGISEIQAHLDYLVEQGEIGSTEDNGVVYYYNAGR